MDFTLETKVGSLLVRVENCVKLGSGWLEQAYSIIIFSGCECHMVIGPVSDSARRLKCEGVLETEYIGIETSHFKEAEISAIAATFKAYYCQPQIS